MSPEHKRFKIFFKEILPSTNRPYRDQIAANQKMHVSNGSIKDVLSGDTKFLLTTRNKEEDNRNYGFLTGPSIYFQWKPKYFPWRS